MLPFVNFNMEFNYILNDLDNSKLNKAPQFPHKIMQYWKTIIQKQATYF